MFWSGENSTSTRQSAQGGSRGSGGSRDDVVSRARAERVRRQQRRLQEGHADVLNRLFRGRLGLLRERAALRADWDKKMEDIGKLAFILKGSFVLPVPPTIQLTRELVFFYDRDEDKVRVERLCSLMLLTSLAQPIQGVPSKNLLTHVLTPPEEAVVHKLWFSKLLLILVSNAVDNAAGGVPERPPSAQGLQRAPHVATRTLEAMVAAPAPYSNLAVTALGPMLFSAVRELALSMCSAVAHPESARLPINPAPALSGLRQLLQQSMLVDCGNDLSSSGSVTLFSLHLLTLPLFAPVAGIDYSCGGGQLFTALVTSWHRFFVPRNTSKDSPVTLPPSPSAAAPSSLYLLANMCYIVVAVVTAQRRVEPALLVDALNVISDCLELAPPGVMSDRGALTIERHGNHIKTLVIPQPVVDQVQFLCKETFVRRICDDLLSSVDETVLKVSRPEELKEVAQALRMSTLELTDQSNREQQRQNARWFGARWACRLAQSMGDAWSSLDHSRNEREEDGGQGHTTAAADARDKEGKPATRHHVDALTRLMASLLYKSYSLLQPGATSAAMLNTAAFGSRLVPKLWAYVEPELAEERACRRLKLAGSSASGPLAAFPLFCAAYAHVLVVLDDEELYEDGLPLPLHQVLRVIKAGKVILYNGCVAKASGSIVATPHDGDVKVEYGAFVFSAVSRLLKSLHCRWSRRAFCPPEVWVIPDTEGKHIRKEMEQSTPLGAQLLSEMPYCITFDERLSLCSKWLQSERAYYQQDRPPLSVKIRRAFVLEDGLALLSALGERLRSRLCITYISTTGHQETGIDLGGLFKDLWTDLAATVFDLGFGLFRQTSEGLLYPNPSSAMIHGADHLRLFEFVGKILGKAVYEGIPVSPVFTHFFLGSLKGQYDYSKMANDLCTLDREVYKNLQFLRTFTGDVSDLALTFSVVDDDLGLQTEVELVPNGRDMPVTNANKFRYIHLVAKHYIHDRIRLQTESFVRGFHNIITPALLSVFNEAELQILISGSPSGIDIESLKAHTRYTAGYHAADRNVRWLWTVLREFPPAEQAAFLRFVTSCPRPPPLGFGALDPPFTVQRIGISSDGEKLPSASTCFNVLKLPTYSSMNVLRQKLRTSITSGAGFDLT